jgi:C4-dicarboxylate transporter DctM subunit
MLSLVIFSMFFLLALAGIPLMFALLATTLGVIGIYGMSHPLETIFLSFIGGLSPLS